ncbi:hypothetical protein BOTBODRAFT_309997 [Botryobasidium botryosum FD-172 SS1]|uniref:F-box domain-containing protein n=1 Tax=Botryobasidium botryosum (strain FD-172 SS1) TaxID=930990 RepID=A0A067MY26_BOTB1|nr:hypothetical protein BOTBODRAFT_309997 [Botryobasidium botryosum FD-172 SS1]
MRSSISSQLMAVLIDDIRRQLGLGAVTSSENSPVEETRAALDQEMEIVRLALKAATTHMAEQLSRLQFQRNQLASTHRLPIEVMSTIFYFAITCEGEPFRSLLNLSSVCRLWRDIALGCPSLWADLRMLPPALADLFIIRSKAAPLKVGLVFNEDAGAHHIRLSEYVSPVLPHVDRWSVCAFDFRQLVSVRRIMSFLRYASVPAPQLEALVLKRGWSDFIWSTDQAQTIDQLFGGVTPRLRAVTLHAIFIPLTSSIFSGLTRLNLEFIEYTEPDSIHQLLHVFERSPQLEYISWDLKFSFPEPITPESSVVPRISLAQLQDLDMVAQGPLQWVPRHILARLVLPSSCSLSIFGEVEAGRDLSHLLPQYSSTQPNLPGLPTTTKLSIKLEDYIVCRLTGRSAEMSWHASLYAAQNDDLLSKRLVSNLGNIFPMPRLEEVVLWWCGVEYPTLFSVVADFFRRHPNIKDLCLVACPEDFMVDLIVTPRGNLYPKLERLRICQCSCDDSVLIEIVKSRTRVGPDAPSSDAAIKLQHLSLHPRSSFAESTILTLREYVKVDVTDDEVPDDRRMN